MRYVLMFLVQIKRLVYSVVNRLQYRHLIDRSRYKYVHLMCNDKFNKPFVDFLNRHFDPEEHLILCKRMRSLKHPFPQGPNVVEVKSYRGFDFRHARVAQVICHSLFDDEIVDVLYRQRDVLQRKAWWIVWGGDFYNAPRSKKHDFVRAHFHGYWSGVDKEKIISRYKTNANHLSVGYQFPIRKEMLDKIIVERKDKARGRDSGHMPLVQVNNSCDSSDLEMLAALAKYAGHIKVRVVVSYGELQYRDDIIQQGRALFGDDFEYLANYLSPEEYAGKMAEVDVLVLAQTRQQGFGNTLASLYLGRKVFIRSDVATYSFLTKSGVRLGDSRMIGKISLPELLSYNDTDRERARRFALCCLDESKLARCYDMAFKQK